MINFNKNKLINKTLDKYYETFSHTLDTADYVPEKFNNKIHKYIYIFTPLIIWYQNGIEYKISNNVLNNLNTIDDETAYSSFKEFMEFPQASLYLQVKPFNIESL